MAVRFSYDTGMMEVGRYHGAPINVCWSFLLAAVVLSFPFWKAVNGTGLVLALIFAGVLFASIVLHELAHAAVGRRYRVPSKRIDIHIFGGVVHFMWRPQTAAQDAAITVAGPLSNLALGLVAFGLLAVVSALEPGAVAGAPPEPSGILARALRATAYLNIGLCVINLIPAFPLDGGRLAHLAIAQVWTRRTATMIVASLGLVFATFSTLLFFATAISGFPILAPPGFRANWAALRAARSGIGDWDAAVA